MKPSISYRGFLLFENQVNTHISVSYFALYLKWLLNPFTMKQLRIIFLIGISGLLLHSCYSVQFKVSNGQAEPCDTEREDWLSGYCVRELDTVVKVGTITKENTINIKDCESGALHTVEYRNTFGGILLYLVTFGRKRQVKIKYVCIKESN